MTLITCLTLTQRVVIYKFTVVTIPNPNLKIQLLTQTLTRTIFSFQLQARSDKFGGYTWGGGMGHATPKGSTMHEQNCLNRLQALDFTAAGIASYTSGASFQARNPRLDSTPIYGHLTMGYAGFRRRRCPTSLMKVPSLDPRQHLL